MGDIRAFISLNFDHSVNQTISAIQSKLKKSIGQFTLKWESTEKFHLTLRFLGNIEDWKVEGLCKDFGDLIFDFDRIKFQANGIGFFPNPYHPNVMYIGLDEIGDHVHTLVEWIDGIMLKNSIEPDKKFTAHITLGRFRKDNKTRINEKKLITFEPFNVEFDRFYLMESVLDSQGSKYFPVKQFVFKRIEQSHLPVP